MECRRRALPAVLGLLWMLAACGGEPSVDWGAPENFLLREKSTKRDDGVQLEYWSLVAAPAQAVYDALADVEHYPDFIPGVDRVQLLTVDGSSKTVQIAQRVIGRQDNAKVEWTFHPDQRRIEFKTLASNISYNDGSYQVDPSPDGARCLVHSTFLVHAGQGMAQAVPIGVLAQGTRDAFLTAAQGVKKRAARGAK